MLLYSQFIPCLMATLSQLIVDGLPKQFPPDFPDLLFACIGELAAHSESQSVIAKSYS